MVEHLDSVASDLYKAASASLGSKGQELSEEYEDVERKLKAAELELDSEQKVFDGLARDLDEANDRLGDIKAIEAELKRRDEFFRVAEAAGKRADEAREELYSWSTRISPLLLGKDALEKLNEKIQEADANGVLPPPFKPEVLRDLLDANECVCGRNLEPGSVACAHIETVLKKFESLSETGMALTAMQPPLFSINTKIDEAFRRADGARDRMVRATKESTENMEKARLLSQKLGEHDDEQIALLGAQYERAKEAHDRSRDKLLRSKFLVEEYQKKLDALRVEIEKEDSNSGKALEAKNKAALAKKAHQVALEMYTELTEEVRSDVATNLASEFQSMIWKKNSFAPVEIDDDYKVHVRNNLGFEVRGGLSAGETACLAFAFSLTLSRVAGYSYPMVVDSPLGRLSKEVKVFVSAVLTRILNPQEGEGHQLLMLLTDSEYSEEVAEMMSENNPRVFRLKYDEETHVTKAEKIK
jgi:DNA sulfur modification protein DndD